MADHHCAVFADAPLAKLADAVVAGDRALIGELAGGVDLSTAVGDKGVTLLQWAVLNGSVDGLAGLLAAGADPSQAGIDGDTAVHTAAAASDTRCLQLLLAHGADPNAANGRTQAPPLCSALLAGQVEAFRTLLAASGVDVDRRDRTDNTALHVAAQINDAARVLDLLRAGADHTARNQQDATFQRYLFMTRAHLLAEHARRERDAVVAWLAEHGAD